jgi:hypothetical protein
MGKRFITRFTIGAVVLLAVGLLGTVPAGQAATAVKFIATDEPGPWFKCTETTNPGELRGCVDAGSKSLAILRTGDTVQIDNGSGTTNETTNSTNTVHTFTSLLYPTGAANMPYDQPAAFRGSLPPSHSMTRASMSSCASCTPSCLPWIDTEYEKTDIRLSQEP